MIHDEFANNFDDIDTICHNKNILSRMVKESKLKSISERKKKIVCNLK